MGMDCQTSYMDRQASHGAHIRQIVARFGPSDDVEASSPEHTTAHSGDTYDPRWLEWQGASEFAEKFGVTGDGTVDMVGINLCGSYCCPLCSQRFIEQKSMDVHTKFFHQVEEPQGEWL